LAAMRARGQAWLDLAQVLDHPTPEQAVDPRLIAAQRPAPMPPVGVRPKTLSLTHIRTLIRDPYAIYAKYILRLKPLDPLKAGVDARDRGTAFHAILERFAKERPVGETPVDAKSRLLDIAAAVFATETPFPTARALWRAKIERAADHFLSSDTKHDGVMLAVETKGSLRLDPLDFVLSGTPDRIDLLPNGKLHLIDYKTGVAPTPAQQQHFEKQLLLAAAMAERGGFGELGPLDVGVITYVSLGSAEKDQATTVTSEMLDIEWEKLITLMTRYAERKTGYVARRAIFMEKIVGDYDHLARHHEWEMSDRAAPVYVGSKDLP
jgi:ATP-dependent helicase/nuclease subunit B